MVQINFALKEVNCKIVYYGPGMSGKTTNLEIVHEKAPEENKGELTSISTDGDRTLFFDFMPLDLGNVAGMRTKFQLYTVPGQVYYNSTRKLVLQGADGVIFVADSDAEKMQENLESYENLAVNLHEYGKDIRDLPHVIQYNKRDLPGALSVEELDRQMNKFGVPTFEAVAMTGEGVFPTLKVLAGMVLESIDRTDGRRSQPPPAAPEELSGHDGETLAQPASPMNLHQSDQPLPPDQLAVAATAAPAHLVPDVPTTAAPAHPVPGVPATAAPAHPVPDVPADVVPAHPVPDVPADVAPAHPVPDVSAAVAPVHPVPGVPTTAAPVHPAPTALTMPPISPVSVASAASSHQPQASSMSPGMMRAPCGPLGPAQPLARGGGVEIAVAATLFVAAAVAGVAFFVV
ncbi:MAG: ADP-ribosylation factor-like protein [Planctomycetota bacterium]|nr:ADP-ribosylation factor-like protein [Planctomycetota bacterium]